MEMLVIPWWDLYPWWPFVVFCDLSVFLHDGLWCKVQLLWILPYFVVFVTIMAFMVVQLGCSAFRIFFCDFHTISWFSAKFGCFGWNMIFWFGPKRISWLFR